MIIHSKMDTLSDDVILYELLTRLKLNDLINLSQINQNFYTYSQNDILWNISINVIIQRVIYFNNRIVKLFNYVITYRC